MTMEHLKKKLILLLRLSIVTAQINVRPEIETKLERREMTDMSSTVPSCCLISNLPWLGLCQAPQSVDRLRPYCPSKGWQVI